MNEYPKILIVDDHLSAREVLNGMFSTDPYQLAFAENGPQALQMAQELLPDVVLLDVMMPNMDGFEVCTRMRAMPKVAEVPIIMITALDDPQSRLRGIAVGADDFVSKPFDRTELKARVRTITRMNRYRRLLTERTKFEWVVNSAQHGYLLINDQDEILFANQKARVYLGLAADEALPNGKQFLATAVTQYQPHPIAAWQDWPNAQPDNEDHYLVRPETASAKSFWLLAATLNLPNRQVPERIVRLEDVTQKLATTHDRSAFHTIISHKLRTPLNWLIGPLELLISDPDSSKEEMFEFAQMAYDGAVQIQAVVDDVLKYVNLSTMIHEKEGCYLNQIRPLIDKISTDLELKNVHISDITGVIEEKENGRKLALSSEALELILVELLENAQKFHPHKQPAIEIVASLQENKALCLKVQDDGATLSPTQLQRVWIPYDQAEKKLTGEVAGVGLGLPTVAYIVWRVGGKCQIYNRPQKPGVVIEIIIPLI